jgi:hypothetical protein
MPTFFAFGDFLTLNGDGVVEWTPMGLIYPVIAIIVDSFALVTALVVIWELFHRFLLPLIRVEIAARREKQDYEDFKAYENAKRKLLRDGHQRERFNSSRRGN